MRRIAKVYRSTAEPILRLFYASAVLITTIGLTMVLFRDELLEFVLSVLLPPSWIESLRMAHEALFHELGGAILFQVTTATCFSLISLFFFRAKEDISRRAETQITNAPVPSSSLKQELWHEAALVLLTVNVLSIVYLALYFSPESLRGPLTVISVLAVMILFALDMQSFVFFRRDMGVAVLALACVRRPIWTCTIGATLCGPILIAEWALNGALSSFESITVLTIRVVIIIVVNCAVCVLAIPAGTAAALHVLKRTPEPSPSTLVWQRRFRRSQYVIAAGLALFYFAVVGSMLKKVPLKTAVYEVELLSLRGKHLLSDEPPVIRCNVVIHNTHDFLALEVERASLVLDYDGQPLGQVSITVPQIPPRTSRRVPIEMVMDVPLGDALEISFRASLDRLLGQPTHWKQKTRLRMDVEVLFGITLPIYLTR
ncbi:MAG: hypothetical protein ABIG71_04795 [Candidatus Uhrbacteria bacterium]